MPESPGFPRENRFCGGRNKPPDQAVEGQQIGGENRIRRDSPEEKSDVHNLPRRDAVGDDEAENYDPERRELLRDRALYKLRWRHQHCQGDAGGDNELEFDLLHPGSPAHRHDVKDDQEDDRACEKKGDDGKERPVNRQRDQLLSSLSPNFGVPEKIGRVTGGDCNKTGNAQLRSAFTDFRPAAVAAKNAQAQQIESIDQ
jgi:hypothetical protein